MTYMLDIPREEENEELFDLIMQKEIIDAKQKILCSEINTLLLKSGYLSDILRHPEYQNTNVLIAYTMDEISSQKATVYIKKETESHTHMGSSPVNMVFNLNIPENKTNRGVLDRFRDFLRKHV